MRSITAALVCRDEASRQLVAVLAGSPLVSDLLVINTKPSDLNISAEALQRSTFLEGDFFSGETVAFVLDKAKSDYILFIAPNEQIELGARSLERMLQVAVDSGAALLYSDYKDYFDGQRTDHPLIDYQLGSIRDNFDFGAVFMMSRDAARAARHMHGSVDKGLAWAGLYDLRLKLSIDNHFLRIPEPLYTRVPSDRRASGERQFDYVDPRRRDFQLEMEEVATAHLKRIGAYLNPAFKRLSRSGGTFPVRASVVIPVRNRERTISDAVSSVLLQEASFDFNAIVVDNHSTDRTTQILEEAAAREPRIIHLQPERTDLGIGGCWNEAIYSPHCGEYAIQLDSDDLYSSKHALAKIIAKLEDDPSGPYAMLIGAYEIVDFELQSIPPGLIDHREWTRENGRNNALRINGLGAPRAFYVPLLRQIGFPNVSYGEDYSVALRVRREYEIARLYEPIYFARRWEGNSDAALPIVTANRYDSYKDHLRTIEILARKRMNEQ